MPLISGVEFIHTISKHCYITRSCKRGFCNLENLQNCETNSSLSNRSALFSSENSVTVHSGRFKQFTESLQLWEWSDKGSHSSCKLYSENFQLQVQRTLHIQLIHLKFGKNCNGVIALHSS